MPFSAILPRRLRHFLHFVSLEAIAAAPSQWTRGHRRARRRFAETASFGTRTILDYGASESADGVPADVRDEDYHFESPPPKKYIPPRRILDPPPSLDEDNHPVSTSSMSSLSSLYTVSTPTHPATPVGLLDDEAAFESPEFNCPLAPPPEHYRRRRSQCVVVGDDDENAADVCGQVGLEPLRFPF
ncbi:hypothetical protein BV25DRAFT_1920058 [Artomyces pyxidatus]|uniref:Uncharacterized protein n=1 Tax=Artomyces pyxidatus TaxID=48021 RepID=A0ACB8SMW7_9AGAM|nr:hypothetical protein BV25DRAFT_1920058 [Artomyces pyxidatus]